MRHAGEAEFGSSRRLTAIRPRPLPHSSLSRKDLTMTPPAPQAAALARLPASKNTKATKLLAAAAHLLASLERGLPLDAHLLREAMTTAFEAGDQDGAWVWKDAYEASEAAAVLFLRK